MNFLELVLRDRCTAWVIREVGMILICFVLPLLITWMIGRIFRAKGIIKPGDLKIDLG